MIIEGLSLMTTTACLPYHCSCQGFNPTTCKAFCNGPVWFYNFLKGRLLMLNTGFMKGGLSHRGVTLRLTPR